MFEDLEVRQCIFADVDKKQLKTCQIRHLGVTLACFEKLLSHFTMRLKPQVVRKIDRVPEGMLPNAAVMLGDRGLHLEAKLQSVEKSVCKQRP